MKLTLLVVYFVEGFYVEVGCGTGHFTRWFAQQGLQVTGLDESPAMLERARMLDGATYLLRSRQANPP